MIEQQKHWFAARTRDKQEFNTCLFIEELTTEEALDVTIYLPTKMVVRQLKYRKKQVKVPVIRNLLFIHTTKQSACDLSNKYGVQLYYMTDLFTRAMLIVPDKQMDDFMFMMDISPNGVSFNNEHLSIGSKVTVVKGDFCGIEGEVSIVGKNAYVVIRIQHVLTASIKVPKSYLKIIEE